MKIINQIKKIFLFYLFMEFFIGLNIKKNIKK